LELAVKLLTARKDPHTIPDINKMITRPREATPAKIATLYFFQRILIVF
jgi:hypothetical protein